MSVEGGTSRRRGARSAGTDLGARRRAAALSTSACAGRRRSARGVGPARLARSAISAARSAERSFVPTDTVDRAGDVVGDERFGVERVVVDVEVGAGRQERELLVEPCCVGSRGSPAPADKRGGRPSPGGMVKRSGPNDRHARTATPLQPRPRERCPRDSPWNKCVTEGSRMRDGEVAHEPRARTAGDQLERAPLLEQMRRARHDLE